MSAGLLRHAAAAIREQNISVRGFMDDTLLEVAGWLDTVAERLEVRTDGRILGGTDEIHALAVARAYLGEQS